MKALYYAVLLTAFLRLQSCTAAAFDKAHPAESKCEEQFPKRMLGAWEATELQEHFYVDKIAFEKSTVTYEMTAISPGNPASLTLTRDSVELRKLRRDYVFNVAVDSLWICYVFHQPSRNRLEIYGFDEDAGHYVQRFETEDTRQGIEFVKYYATEEEWDVLVKSDALKRVAAYERVR